MESVLVTGATGFIGKALVEKLLCEGLCAHVLTRNPVAAKARLPAEVQTWAWSPSQQTLELPEDVSAVIHLAGESLAHWPWSSRRKEQLWKSRVEPTRLLVEALGRMKHKPAVLISASGMGYYGDGGDREVHVGDPPGGDFLGRLAAAWEAEALKAERLGIRVVLPRFGMVLGSHGGALSKMALPFRFGLGAVLGTGKQYWSWIHIGDAVELLVQAIKDERFRGPVHAVAGESMTQREFSRVLAHNLHRPLWFRVPVPGLRLALGEMADLFLHGQKVSADTSFFVPSIFTLEKALKSTSLLSH